MTTLISDCASVLDAGLPTLHYQHLTDPDEAHRVIADARARAPIAIGPYGPEVLTHGLVRTVLRDDRFITVKGLGLEAQGITSGPLWDRTVRSILSLDGAVHHRLRRLVSTAFAPRAAQRLRTLAVKIITALVEPVTSVGRCDVVTDIARGYPTPVICALLGVPPQDWPLFSGWVDDIKKVLEWNVVNDTPAILAAVNAQDGYIEDLIARRKAALADDLISDLIRADDPAHPGDRLTHDELIALSSALLTAGTDTTRSQLAAAVQVLAAHPEQWDLVARHPELAAAAVTELMRYRPIIFGTIRRAAEDIELAGVRIPAGTLVAANIASANRDPAVHDDPERLDITRQNPPAILNFGGGMHFCLGAHLARLELTEALRVITGRLPNPRLTGPSPWKVMAGVTGPTSVPLEFDPGR
ncbi:cytochrome P450 [Mycobacterium sp. 94-17]|uniref:cytochrome P450 n=1 Tax=Mycobacterium sp. 94-17 TaxID=2986147 RepID=UPI002D1E4E3A|nr:cytochrome P450 [Mycobacterium sp. 94-17]MEB4211153.1 cytochrome P450 [Mycobacterium sp. 94-17]